MSCFALAAAWLLLAGCGNGLETLRGTVTCDGKPLAAATVAFYPDGGGPTAYASTGSNGAYEAKTGSRYGLPAGKYRVSVMATAMVQPDDKYADPISQSLIPEKYSAPTTSGLEITVPAPGGKYDIGLSGK
jgi:hypothetical protein